MPSSCNRAMTFVSFQALARGSRSASSSRRSNNSSSPTRSYNCSVALVASGPTMSSLLIISLSFCNCSGVSGRFHVPSASVLIHDSNMSASFIAFPCCCIRANSGRASSIRESNVCSINIVLMFSTSSSCSPISAGCQDSK